MRFYYEAHNRWGEPTKGEIDAGSEEEAAGKIRAAGLFAREINAEPIGQGKYAHGAVQAGPAQSRVYVPSRDDAPEPAPTVRDERGDPVAPAVPAAPAASQGQSLRMSPPKKPDPISPQIIPEGGSRPRGDRPEPTPEPDDARAHAPRYGDEAPQAPQAPEPERPEDATWRANMEIWRSNLAKDLEGVSAVLSLMSQWQKASEVPEGKPDGVPSVGARTWAIYSKNLDKIASDLIGSALDKAAQRIPPKP